MTLLEKYGLFLVLVALSIGTDTAIREIAQTIGLIAGGMMFTWTNQQERKP